MYITSSIFFGQHGDVIQCFTDSPAIADRLTTQMRDPVLLEKAEQGNLFFVAILRGLVEEFSEPGQSRNVQEGLPSCGEADGFELHERVGSNVHAMMNSKANFRRLGGSAVKAETELIQ